MSFKIQKVESSKAENAFIASIMTIIAVAFPMMLTRSSQMNQPPNHQEQDEEQTVYAI
jgi:hypothetical protein